MKLRVAYNQHGEILAVTEGGSQADQIVAPPGVTEAELDVPTKFEKAKFEDFVHRLHVDVSQEATSRENLGSELPAVVSDNKHCKNQHLLNKGLPTRVPSF